MSEQTLGYIPSAHPDEALSIGPRAETFVAGLEGQVLDEQVLNGRDLPRSGVTLAEIEDARALARTAKEQLARDLADIEHATAALRLAEPALQSWSQPAMPSAPVARPVWLVIGVLWLSTAIVTVGAAVAIAALAG
jgi:hypothetical protein